MRFIITSFNSVGYYRKEDRVVLSNEDVPKASIRWSKELPLDSPLCRLLTSYFPENKELSVILDSLVPIEDYEDDEHGEMALIGVFPTDTDGLIAYVNADDDYLQPHFHLRSDDHTFHAAIEFLRPAYLPHLRLRRDILSEEQLDWLIKFFQTDGIHDKFSGTIWDLACWDWERNNAQGYGIPRNHKMLDYRELLGGGGGQGR